MTCAPGCLRPQAHDGPCVLDARQPLHPMCRCLILGDELTAAAVAEGVLLNLGEMRVLVDGQDLRLAHAPNPAQP